MKLNIYKRGEVVKTYTAETYTLMFGVLEDVAELVHLDQIEKGDEVEFVRVIGGAIISSVGAVQELMLDIFPGMTADELRHTSVEEVLQVILDVVLYTIKKLKENAGKNLPRV